MPRRKALTPEARDNQLITLAVNLAEQQLLDGTASSQVITHYLKLGAMYEREKLEREILEKQRDLLAAKTEAIKSEERSEEAYTKAIEALRMYRGDPE